MDFKWLKDFMALKELKNFSAAAKSRYVTQSAFSRRIRALESWIGVPLFDRTAYPIELTEYGERFIPYVEHLLKSIVTTKSDFEQFADHHDDEVRIDCLHSFAINLLPKLFSQASEYFSDLILSLNPSVQGLDNQFQSLLDNSSDFLFTYNTPKIHPEFLLKDQLDSFVVSKENVIPVISPELLDAIQDGDTFPYLAYAKQTFLYTLVEPLVIESPVKLHKTFEATLNESLVKMAIDGHGLTWAPWHAVEKEIERGNLVHAFSDNKKLTSTLEVICYRSKHVDRDAVEQFWNGLKMCAANHA